MAFACSQRREEEKTDSSQLFLWPLATLFWCLQINLCLKHVVATSAQQRLKGGGIAVVLVLASLHVQKNIHSLLARPRAFCIEVRSRQAFWRPFSHKVHSWQQLHITIKVTIESCPVFRCWEEYACIWGR